LAMAAVEIQRGDVSKHVLQVPCKIVWIVKRRSVSVGCVTQFVEQCVQSRGFMRTIVFNVQRWTQPVDGPPGTDQYVMFHSLDVHFHEMALSETFESSLFVSVLLYRAAASTW
jgi:hypothetical protein